MGKASSSGPDWNRLSHAYGPATDTPTHLEALLSPDSHAREQGLEHLWAAVLHQGTTYAVTAPAAEAVSRLISDSRTLRPVANWTDVNHPPRPLREFLIDFLAAVAESTMHEPPGMTFAELARPQTDEVEHAVAALWRGDYDTGLSGAGADRAMNVYVARAILQSRSVLGEIAPRVLVHLTSNEPGVRTSAINAAAKFAEALHEHEFTERVLAALETLVLDADPRDRASFALSIGELGGRPTQLLEDDDFLVRSCAALAPALASDPIATRLVLEAFGRPDDIDQLADGLPQFEMRPRFSFVRAAVARVGSFDELLPGALEVARVASAHTVEWDIGPLLGRAFTEPHGDSRPLSRSQRAFLDALVKNDKIWDKRLYNPKPWFNRVGLTYDREACRTTLNAAKMDS